MGLAGWIDYSRDLRDERLVVNAMAAALNPAVLHHDVVRLSRRAGFAHRGPAAGYADWRHNERPDPDVVLAIDGRLTNRRDVERRLFAQPRALTTDAEVLLHAYRRWGAGLVDRIGGTYAMAVWDNQACELLLVRDPLGAKTLFYTVRGNSIVFATRATALLANPDVEPVVDAGGLNELLTLGPVRTPGHGVIRGVREVLPGELLKFTPDGIRRHRHHALAAVPHDQDLEATARSVRRAIADATAPLCARPAGAVLLSGGIASTTAAAFTTPDRDGGPAAWTLTAGGPWDLPPGAGIDVRTAILAAKHLRLRHTVLRVTSEDLVEAATAAREILDFPGDSALDASLHLLLRRAAGAGATSVVTGDGADAIFGGYPWSRGSDAVAFDDFPWRRQALGPTHLLTVAARMHLVPGGYRKQRFADAAATVPGLDGEDLDAGRERRVNHLTLTHYLPHLLARIDQLATASGLTAHTPFADWALAQYLVNVPWRLRHLHGIPKGLLRQSIADILPAEVACPRPRPLPGLDLLPLWQLSQRQRLHDVLADPRAPLSPLLDRRRVTNLLTRPPTRPVRDWHTTIGRLIEVNAWLARHHVTLA